MGRVAAICAVIAGLFLCAAQAAAAMPDPWQQWANNALVPTVADRVALSTDPCPSYGYSSDGTTACFDPNGAQPTIHLAGPHTYDRTQFFHELGHAFDASVMTGASRAGFVKIMRYRTSSWTATSPGSDESAEERFASAYSLCARRSRVSRDSSLYGPGHGYGYQPTASQHRRVCALVRRAATR
jgi:hypothetical protein